MSCCRPPAGRSARRISPAPCAPPPGSRGAAAVRTARRRAMAPGRPPRRREPAQLPAGALPDARTLVAAARCARPPADRARPAGGGAARRVAARGRGGRRARGAAASGSTTRAGSARRSSRWTATTASCAGWPRVADRPVERLAGLLRRRPAPGQRGGRRATAAARPARPAGRPPRHDHRPAGRLTIQRAARQSSFVGLPLLVALGARCRACAASALTVVRAHPVLVRAARALLDRLVLEAVEPLALVAHRRHPDHVAIVPERPTRLQHHDDPATLGPATSPRSARCPRSIPRPEYVGKKRPRTGRPGRQDAETIERMRVAGRIAAQAMAEVAKHIAPGVTTDELDRVGHEFLATTAPTRPRSATAASPSRCAPRSTR